MIKLLVHLGIGVTNLLIRQWLTYIHPSETM